MLQQRLLVVWKTAYLLMILYVFTCSLDLLSRGFRLISGKETGLLFNLAPTNKLFGVMIGILTTVILHSSSTLTSIVVAMVISGSIEIRQAIPIILGSNIGTSITTSLSTLISFPKAGEVEQFRLAFSSATLHSMFNWCSVVAVIVIECITEISTEDGSGYLENVSFWLTELVSPHGSNTSEINFLYTITKPAVNLIVQINNDALTCYSQSHNSRKSGQKKGLPCFKSNSNETLLINCTETYPSLIKCRSSNATCSPSIFGDVTWLDDQTIGVIITVIAVVFVVSCLLMNVKILKSIVQGTLATYLTAILKAEIPHVPWLTEYLAILFGTVATVLIQSSSVFTSSIAPLVGLNFLDLKRAYPLTIGANIGTCGSALMTALAAANCPSQEGVQIALCHLLFNLTGTLIFYPIPFLRFPIIMAMYLGQRTAMYRWFAGAFMALMFVFGPILFMFLSSFWNGVLALFTAGMIIAVVLFFICVNIMREQCPGILPDIYISWKWLPKWIRSLKPYDEFISACCTKAAESSARALSFTNRSNNSNTMNDNNRVEVEMERVNAAFEHEQ